MNKINFFIFLLLILFRFTLYGQNNKKIVFFIIKDSIEMDTLNTYGYIDYQNKIFIPEDLKNKIYFKDGLTPLICENYFGYMNNYFELIIPFKYDCANFFYNDLALVQYDEDLLLINKNDSLILKFKYKLPPLKKMFLEKNDWLIKIKKNDLIYQIDTNYKINELINLQIKRLDTTKNHFFVINFLKNKLNADSCIYLHYHYIGFKKDNLIGLADTNGVIILPPLYDQVTNFDEEASHLFKVRKNSKFGVFYKSHFLIDPIYDEIFLYKDCYIAKKDNKYSVIDRKGQNIISGFDFCSIANEGFIKVYLKFKNGESINEKIGYFNYFGEQITSIQFEDGGIFKEGFCPIKNNGKWGFINSYGQIVVPSIYDLVLVYQNKRVFVKYNKKWGLLDQYGINITEFKYDEVKSFSEGYAAVCINNKWGYIDKNGKEVTPIIFNYCSDFEDGKGYLDIRGKITEIDIDDIK